MTAQIICFGEMLLRMTAPGRERLMQSGRFDVHVGGAEANVAVGLSRLGHHTAMVGIVPDNALGGAAVAALRAQGVDCGAVQRVPGRMGLYFLSHGAGVRASEIVYDRSGSAFASADQDAFDWPALLEGAEMLHLSGITSALGPDSAVHAIAAAEAARTMGLKLSFDCNYRASLWEAWDSAPRDVLTRLIRSADILFGNHRDFALVLDRAFGGDHAERRREAATAMFDAFPQIELIASTAREIIDTDNHRLSARIDLPNDAVQTDTVALSGIVDRIGSGDAFAAGILHGVMNGDDAETTVASGLALACLKHTVPGDVSLFDQGDIDSFRAGAMDVRR